MELTQIVAKPKVEVDSKLERDMSDSSKGSGMPSFPASHDDSMFVSASHEFAVKQYEQTQATEDADTNILKAEKVAHSMGFSQSYDKNPFDAETQRELARAYEAGERQQERVLEESRIGKDSKDMEYDS